LANPVHLKLSLAVYGIRLGDELAKEELFSAPASARDFASRDIELLLPEDIIARCHVGTRAAAKSPYVLQSNNDRFVVVDGAGEETQVRVVAPPRFYNETTSLGTPMWQIGTVHAGYLSIDPATTCGFTTRGVACQFCTMQGGSPELEPEPMPRSVDEVLEVVHAAFEEGAAEFVYFNTGYFDSDDGGFGFLQPYVEEVKKHFDTLVALQIHPPKDNRWIDLTYAAGVDALSYAIEIHDPVALARFCKGRTELIGRDRYYDALAYAATIFPSGTVWSDLIIGLEPLESTKAGITALTEMGILPVLSLFRPLDETELSEHALPDPADIAPVYAHLYNSVRDARINVQFMRDLGYAVTPIEARFFAGEDAKLDVAVSSFFKSKIGSRAVRGLSKLRRRLRVKRVSESFDSSRL
jgi:hypothetical protein